MSAITDYQATQVATCSCGGVLSFCTDHNGHVLEECSRCHAHGGMRPAPARLPVVRTINPNLSVGGPCIDCGRRTYKHQHATAPKRCFKCRDKHNNMMASAWHTKHRKLKRQAHRNDSKN